MSNLRRVLCVFPTYARSFGTFHHAYPLLGGVRAFMPPQGLLLIAAALPAAWEVRFVDENVRPLRAEDLAWADAVLLTGMHVQRGRVLELNALAQRAGKVTVLGGPSVSACEEWYEELDIIHKGELGDATAELFAHLDATVSRPRRQLRFETKERTPLASYPVPAYHLIDVRSYFIANVQYSSGCPFRCEFCDIPELYGRNPRLKTPEQLCRELDAIMRSGPPGAVYFVDDNFVGNHTAALELLPHLIEWQRRHGYPVKFACEATLNLARNARLLGLMREASFATVFCGIETPSPEALRAMEKRQNLALPLLDGVAALNAHGLEVVSGAILGLDTDGDDVAERLLEFIEASRIPMLTINILYALPKTPLHRRLAAEGRLLPEEVDGSNVRFRRPRDAVRASWLEVVGRAFEPRALYRRFEHQLRHTYPNRLDPSRLRRVRGADVARGAAILARIAWRVGVRADYRDVFWRVLGPELRAGRVEEVINVAAVSHHLIEYARDCARGAGDVSFFSRKEDASAARR